MELLDTLLHQPAFTLFAVVALGMWLGAYRVAGISLGASGVLLVALVFGHFGRTVPREVTDLGLLLFVYAVGLQSGPRVAGLFRRSAKTIVLIGLASAGAGAAAAVGLARLMHLSPALAAGLYSGATTCTPALAAALECVSRIDPAHAPAVSVGYGLAYPFSAVGMVVLIQLLPRLRRQDASEAGEQARREDERRTPPLEALTFRLTNPNCAGLTIAELGDLGLADVRVSRVKREGHVSSAKPDTVLRLHDVLMVVGARADLARMPVVIGEAVSESVSDPTGNVTSQTVIVSRPAAFGRTLESVGASDRFCVVVTRVRREGVEFTPGASFELEAGDLMRVVGQRTDIEAFAQAVGREEQRLDETALLPFALGILLGALLGSIPIPLPGGIRTTLGLGGGVFTAALLLTAGGRIGSLRLYVPNAARGLARDLGLVMFLAGAGAAAGQRLAPIIAANGLQLLLAGGVVTVVTVGVAMLLLTRLARWNMLSVAGALSGYLTSSPSLGAANRLADSGAASIAFAAVYPIGLLAKAILAQLIFLLLRV